MPLLWWQDMRPHEGRLTAGCGCPARFFAASRKYLHRRGESLPSIRVFCNSTPAPPRHHGNPLSWLHDLEVVVGSLSLFNIW
jgi:hypothetical protein